MDRSAKDDGRSVALDNFPLGRGMWAMTITLYVFVSFIGLIALATAITEPDPAGVAFTLLFVGGLVLAGYWLAFRNPRRVEVLAEGLRLVAPAKCIFIPWGSLRLVASPPFDLNRWSLRWEWDGQRIETWGPYGESLNRLLHIIRQKAPVADLSRATTRRPTWLFHRRGRR